MLRKTNLRALAETVGLVPSLAEAQAAAEQRRQALTEAQQAVDAAAVSLDATHDAGAPAATIQQAEAVLSDARLTADRAQLAYAAAERRLNAAKESEQSKARAAAIVARDAALAKYTKAAAELDRLAADMAVHIQSIDDQYSAFNESRRDNVAGPFTPISGDTLADFAIKRAIAERAGVWTGDKPTAAELAERVLGAALAVA